ncbi:GNAT superfamily N-acetyltransferase [Microbacteriaceae bacterium SG_E_30_P1]|uniref:GNAT superfamily N-acetyltransferase n=1 Tax=Antiquaquibacter oligotrophicus TaxID=2880260 RepID=A0ABT6KSA6_9MICO|nr:GNAT family N-acetyltransferase [Antiquaquibacter oligotrophicus]MDH6181962.1 GNAT superfamily N-acetyltransferase [Antiquaquibacter oligotrophicus]UDF12369.1 GNAT family N-acetyltransferase [Antiquaquibacter oligotrophicus]
MTQHENYGGVKPDAAAVPAFGIRVARPEDAVALHELAAATFPLACPPDALPESIQAFINEHLSVAAFERYLADPARELFLAEDPHARPLGYAMLVHGRPTDSDVLAAVGATEVAELSKLYVLPESHGSGLSAALVERSVAAARARGATGLWLGVNQFNARANRFYEKSGFVRVGTKRFKVGERFEDDFVRLRALNT